MQRLFAAGVPPLLASFLSVSQIIETKLAGTIHGFGASVSIEADQPLRQ